MKFSCPHCSASLNVPEEKIGKVAKCPRCENALTITREEPQVPSIVAARDVPRRDNAAPSHKWLWTSQTMLAGLCVAGFFFPRTPDQPAAASVVSPAPVSPEMPEEEAGATATPQAVRIGSQGMFDQIQAQRIEIVAEDGGPKLVLGALPSGEVGLIISDGKAEKSSQYALVMNQKGEVQEVFLDGEGRLRLEMGINAQGAASLIFHGTESQKRMILSSIAETGAAGLVIFDREGKPTEAFLSN